MWDPGTFSARNGTGASRSRAIRVFVSSTFADMQTERDELLKRVFPRLRKRCESRGVTWGEVDLRWGITDEQTADGEVLPICLDEIRNCRPYFLGLLGERYGWVPLEIPAHLLEREPWLGAHRGRSVTEMEILHGVLNDPEMAGHAFFYFRSPAWLERLPAEAAEAFRERATPEEMTELGPGAAERRAEERRGKLRALKARIRASGFPVREEYPDPKALGQLVLEDLTGVIDRLFPEGSEPEPLDREAVEHEAFARSRARVYIARPDYFEVLDRHARGKEPPLAVLGESGAGKSALLANWALRYREHHSDVPLLLHFVGSSAHSTDWTAMLRRILGEFERIFGIHQEIPDGVPELRAAFASALHRVAARGRAVLLLDGLNQLEDRDEALDLLWLPETIPDGVRIVLSTLPGRPLEEIERRGWPTLEVTRLEAEECRQLIEEYLAQFRKELSPERLDRIAAAPQSGNPLYVRGLLEELRMWGEHETLDTRIDHYLSAASPDELYGRILERYEEDFEEERPALVGDTLSLLWASRRGMAEAELLDLLGSDGDPMPAAYWAPLHLAIEASLVDRSGLLAFAHPYVGQAVRDRYLSSEDDRVAAHLRLADYFAARDVGRRSVDELPWQLARAGAWERLRTTLADLPFVAAAYEANPFELSTFWTQVEKRGGGRLVEAFAELIRSPAGRDPGQLSYVASLLHATGHLDEATSLWEHLVGHARAEMNRDALQGTLGNLGVVLQHRGDFDRALPLLEEQARIALELGDMDSLSDCLINQATIHGHRDEHDAALDLLRSAEEHSRTAGNLNALQMSLGNQGVIYQKLGDLDRAAELHEEEERICRELGDPLSLQSCLGNRAVLFMRHEEFDAAWPLLEEQERVCREIGEVALLLSALGNQAYTLEARGDPDGALERLREIEAISREVGDGIGLHNALANIAVLYWKRGDLDTALAVLKEQEGICRDLGDDGALRACLSRQTKILEERGDPAVVARSREEEERGEERIGKERADDEETLASIALRVATLGKRALKRRQTGDVEGALGDLEEQERLCREIDDERKLQGALGGRALLLHELGRDEEAVTVAREYVSLCRRRGDAEALDAALRVKAEILRVLVDAYLERREDFGEILKLTKEQEDAFVEVGANVAAAAVMSTRATGLAAIGRRQEALEVCERALDLAESEGVRDLVENLRGVRESIRRGAL